MPTNKILSNRQNTEQRKMQQEKQEMENNSNEDSEEFGYYDLSILPPPRRRSLDSPFVCLYRSIASGLNKTMLRCLFGVGLIYFLLNLIPRSEVAKNDYKSTGNAILIWNEDEDLEWDHFQCGCHVTTNHNYDKRPIDAVVVYGDRPYSLQGLDKIKHTPNYLVVFSARSPLSLAQNPLYAHADSVFNFTMTYRLDSDLIWTYFYFSTFTQVDKRLQEFDLPQYKLVDELSADLRLKLKQKDFLVTYIMYEVNEYSLPESLYLEQLRIYMDLDAHDTCYGHQTCSHYKFMLIFDPSSCPDYVHPHFYMAMANFVVPVMIGGGNLTNLAPSGSYISNSDFDSPMLLAKHLKMLGKEPKLYERFFWWHSEYQLQKIRQPYCTLCQQLGIKRQQRQPGMFLNWWTQYQCSNRSDRLGWSNE